MSKKIWFSLVGSFVFAILFVAIIVPIIYAAYAVITGGFMMASLVAPVSWPVNLSWVVVNQTAVVVGYLFAVIGSIVGFIAEWNS